MTVEEAVERILAGRPFTQCAPCLGTGKVGSPLWGVHELCKSCDGHASYCDPAYSEACRVLGRPAPKNSIGLFVRMRNQLDLQKLRPDTVRLSPEDMKDVMDWGKEP